MLFSLRVHGHFIFLFQCDVSPSQKAEQMETDVVSPAQIHIEVETGRPQNSLSMK